MRFWRGLPAQILLWTIVPLILVLVAVSFGSIALHQQSMRDMVAERDAQLAILGASRLNDSLQERILALQTLIAHARDHGNVQEALAGDAPLLTNFDLGSTILPALPAQERQAPGNFAAINAPGPRLQQVMDSAGLQPGQPVVVLAPGSDGSAEILIGLADPQTGETALGAVSGRGLGLSSLMDQVGHGRRAVAFLVDRQGKVLYDRNPAEIGRDLRAHGGIPEVTRGESGAAFAQLPGEDEHVIGYAPIQLTGWGLIVEEPWQDVVVPMLRYTLLAPLVVLAAAIASLAALYFGLRRVVRPLQMLGRESSRLAWGDFQAIDEPVEGIAEIRELQRTLQEMAAQIRRYQAGMQDYIAALTQGQEDERKRLARELHDETVQSLIALSQRVTMLDLDLAEGFQHPQPASILPQLQGRIGELSTMLTQTLGGVRDLIRDLRPIYLEELGLVSALEMLAQATQRDDLETSFEVNGEERRLSPETEMAVYRIAQAALSNVARHARASRAAITLEYSNEGVTLSAEDNGGGFVPPEMPNDLAAQGHFGLVGMYERATRLGGHFSIRSAPGQGTLVIAFVPGPSRQTV